VPRTQALIAIYTLFGNKAEAKSVSMTLIDEHLVACANILSESTSMYRWQSSVQKENEIPVLYKTTARMSRRVIRRLAQLHSYKCPCIVAIPVTASHSAYSKWIQEAVQS
jgi:periplasmic divalent cation tolerance protein